MFDGESATPWLKVADGAVPVQDKRWRLPAGPSSPDHLNGLARPDDVVPNPHATATVAIAVDQCSGVCQCPDGLRQRERTKTNEQVVGKVRLVPG